MVKESGDTFQIEVCDKKRIITKLYNKFKILTGKTSYVIDPHDGKKSLVSSQVHSTLS